MNLSFIKALTKFADDALAVVRRRIAFRKRALAVFWNSKRMKVAPRKKLLAKGKNRFPKVYRGGGWLVVIIPHRFYFTTKEMEEFRPWRTRPIPKVKRPGPERQA